MSPLRLAVFLGVVLSITFGLHYYLWARLIRDTALPAPYATLGTWAIAVLGLLVPVGMIAIRTAPRAVSVPLGWVVYVWMGLMFFLFVLTLGADVVRGAMELGRWIGGQPAPDPARRQFIARAAGAAVGLGALGLGGAALAGALVPVQIKRVRVGLGRLPEALSGYTIVQLSDIHVGTTIGREFIEQLVAKTNALAPDLVAITGDLVDGSVRELGHAVAPLAGLRARDGVYFVTGNHEYYSGADEWIAHLRTLGIRVLRNERVTIQRENGAAFDLAGVDDATAHQFGGDHGADIARALAGRSDTTRPVVLLAHQPIQVREAARHGVALQLSGHTHGGQMFPFNYLVKLQQPYVAGLHEHGETKLYVSRGTGYWGPPMRLGAPAEITRLELLAV